MDDPRRAAGAAGSTTANGRRLSAALEVTVSGDTLSGRRVSAASGADLQLQLPQPSPNTAAGGTSWLGGGGGGGGAAGLHALRRTPHQAPQHPMHSPATEAHARHHRRPPAHPGGSWRRRVPLLCVAAVLGTLLPLALLMHMSVLGRHASSAGGGGPRPLPDAMIHAAEYWDKQAWQDGDKQQQQHHPTAVAAAAGAAGSTATAAAAAEPAGAATAGGSAGAAGGPEEPPCIPRSRATPWHIALQEAEAAAAAAGAQQQPGGAGDASQQGAGGRRAVLQQQQQEEGAGPLPGTTRRWPRVAVVNAAGRRLAAVTREVAGQLVKAALALTGGDEAAAHKVLKDKALVAHIIAGLQQAKHQEMLTGKLLAAAAGAAAAGPGSSSDAGFDDAEASDAPGEPWPTPAPAAAAAAGNAAAAGGNAAAGAAATADFSYDEEAADAPEQPWPQPGSSSSSSADSSSSTSAGAGGSAPAAAAAAAAVSQQPHRTPPEQQQQRQQEGVSSLRVALVNDVEFHHEVTLGLMAALQRFRANLQVYLHSSLFKEEGAGAGAGSGFGLVSYINAALPGSRLLDAHHKAGITPCDVAVFASPEFSIPYYREFLARATPRLVLVFIHEPDMALSRLQYIINMHPLVAVAALSPHVAELVRSRMRMHAVHWMLPVLPAACGNACWEGFAVQGKFEAGRRAYGELWQDMEQLLSQQQVQAPTQQRRALSSEQLPQLHSNSSSSSVHARVAGSVTSTRRLRTRSGGMLGAVAPGRGTRAAATASTPEAAAAADVTAAIAAAAAEGAHGSADDDALSAAAAAAAAGDAAAAAAAAGAGLPLPRINLLGSGDVRALGMPPALQPHVVLYRGLRYADFYDTLCRSLALLPLFNASGGYLSTKISSSVLASLATGVPMVAPPAFLATYSAFSSEHVITLPDDGRGEQGSGPPPLMALLQRLAGGAATRDELAAARAALGRLRSRLNSEAGSKLEGLLAGALGRPHAGPKQD